MLNKRLQACAAWVTTGGVVCDVGTDHAYLAAELLRNGVCRHVIASDIGEGPLQAAKRTLEQASLLEQATLKLSDGLQQIDGTDVTDVVIAGMGGETIVHILEPCEWIQNGVNLILQPMTKIPLLRKWLAENGYLIDRENIVKESRFFYTVMQVHYNGKQRKLTPLEAEIGIQDWNAPVVQAYLQRKKNAFRRLQHKCKREISRKQKPISGLQKKSIFIYRKQNVMLEQKGRCEMRTVKEVYQIMDAFAPFSTQEKLG